MASHVRDELIAARGCAVDEDRLSEKRKPQMLIDLHGISHGFCISESGRTCCNCLDAQGGQDHSEIVAEKVKSWVDAIVESSTRSGEN